MQTTRSSAGLALVSDDVEDLKARGAAIKRRRLAAGIPTVNAWSELLRQPAPGRKAMSMDRTTIGKAEAGESSPGSIERLEAWLDAWEHEISSEREEMGADEATSQEVRSSEFFELEITVDAVGLHIVGKAGPDMSPDEVTRQVAELYRQVREKGE